MVTLLDLLAINKPTQKKGRGFFMQQPTFLYLRIKHLEKFCCHKELLKLEQEDSLILRQEDISIGLLSKTELKHHLSVLQLRH